MTRTKREYDFDYPTPLPYERSLYNLGMDPRGYAERNYKNLDIKGLALEFAKFEKLYDTNYQVYHWLYHTGYGVRLFDILLDLVMRDYPDEPPYITASKLIADASLTL